MKSVYIFISLTYRRNYLKSSCYILSLGGGRDAW